MNEVLSYSQSRTDLSAYNNDWYNPGASALKRTLWYLVNAGLFINPLNPVSSLKVKLLRLFGARVGKGVTLKPNINIKYPWLLEIGDHVWIGEGVWIDNLAPVSIGSHVCISQGALLLTGNHNYKKKTFDLMVGKITLADGAWIGDKSVVCPGVTCGSHSVLAVGSVAVKDLKPYFIYQGNPAVPVRERTVE